MKNKKLQYLFIAFLIGIAFALLNIDISYAGSSSDLEKAWKALYKQYRILLAGVCGMGALTSLLIFIIHFIRLGGTGSNPIQREKVLRDILVSGICTALLGGITVIVVLFFSIIFL